MGYFWICKNQLLLLVEWNNWYQSFPFAVSNWKLSIYMKQLFVDNGKWAAQDWDLCEKSVKTRRTRKSLAFCLEAVSVFWVRRTRGEGEVLEMRTEIRTQGTSGSRSVWERTLGRGGLSKERSLGIYIGSLWRLQPNTPVCVCRLRFRELTKRWGLFVFWRATVEILHATL